MKMASRSLNQLRDDVDLPEDARCAAPTKMMKEQRRYAEKHLSNADKQLHDHFRRKLKRHLDKYLQDLEDDEEEEEEEDPSEVDDEQEKIADVKIVDLGNACLTYHHRSRYIMTFLYRSPEVILDLGYDSTVDIWSAACVIFELATGTPLFDNARPKCKPDVGMLAQMIELLGPFPQYAYSGAKEWRKFFSSSGDLRHTGHLHRTSLKHRLEDEHEWSSDKAEALADFLEPMLRLDPSKRASAFQCLEHSWITKRDEQREPPSKPTKKDHEKPLLMC